MSESFEKREYWLALYDIYGELLTQKQKDIFQDVYEADLSFSEIAENLSISKAAVSDSVKRTCAVLEEYESVLEIHKNKATREDLYTRLEMGELDVASFLQQIREID